MAGNVGCLAGEKVTKVHVLFAQVTVAQRARVAVKCVHKLAENILDISADTYKSVFSRYTLI